MPAAARPSEHDRNGIAACAGTEAEMDLEEARRVVKERKPGVEGYVQHVTACAVIYANHMTTRHGNTHFGQRRSTLRRRAISDGH